MDYDVLSAEIIRALRGKRSQLALSRYLGYRSNVVRTWEARRRFPTASRFFKMCARIGIDPDPILLRLYREPPAWFRKDRWTTPEFIYLLLKDLKGSTSIKDISQRSEINRFTVSRWFSGQAEPRLPHFLLMIETTSLRLLDFLMAFVDLSLVPSAVSAWNHLEIARRLAVDLPWSQAVLRVLELNTYRQLERHEPGFIARKLGISIEEEIICLRMLAKTEQIKKRRRLWTIEKVQTVDTRNDPEKGRKLLEWWAQIGIERVRTQKGGLFSYNVFSVSDDDFERLKSLHLNYFRQLRSIVAQSQSVDRVAVVNIQLFELD